MSYDPIVVRERLPAKHFFEANLIFGTLEGEPVVLKTFAEHPRLARRLGGWLVGRERRFYQMLEGAGALADGTRWLPEGVRAWGRWGVLLPHVEGRPLRHVNRGELPLAFITRLQESVARLHGERVVHLDLANARNILVTPAGDPVLLDFAGSLSFRRVPLLGQSLTRLFGRIDRMSVLKWKARLFPEAMTPEETRFLHRMLTLRRLWPFPLR